MRRVILCMIIAAIGVGANAAGNGNSQPGDNVWEQLQALQAQLDALNPIPQSVSIAVDCDAGDTITDALSTRAEELDITFSGMCSEEVNIDRPNVSISGQPGSVVDGSIRVLDEGKATLTDVNIINAADNGLHISVGAVNAVRLNVSGATQSGILVFGGSLHCADCSSNNNGGDGLLVTSTGRAIIGGDCEFNNNGAEGLEAGYASSLGTIPDSTDIGAATTASNIDVVGNGGYNILVYGGSSFSTTPGDTLTSTQSGIGMLVASGGTAHVNGDYQLHGNSVFGLGALGGTVFIGLGPGGGASMEISGSAFGVFVDDDGTIRGGGSIDTSNNGTGFFVRASYFGDAAITANNNGVAGRILLGATVNLPYAQINGFIACDGTELIQGGLACGPNPVP